MICKNMYYNKSASISRFSFHLNNIPLSVFRYFEVVISVVNCVLQMPQNENVVLTNSVHKAHEENTSTNYLIC